MGLDIDFIAADNAINDLKKILSDIQHGEREKIADDIIEFVDKMAIKYKKVSK